MNYLKVANKTPGALNSWSYHQLSKVITEHLCLLLSHFQLCLLYEMGNVWSYHSQLNPWKLSCDLEQYWSRLAWVQVQEIGVIMWKHKFIMRIWACDEDVSHRCLSALSHRFAPLFCFISQLEKRDRKIQKLCFGSLPSNSRGNDKPEVLPALLEGLDWCPCLVVRPSWEKGN